MFFFLENLLNVNSRELQSLKMKVLPVFESCLLSQIETAVDRQISFPLSNVFHANGQRNGQPLLHDFAEDIQFMDVEETPCKKNNYHDLYCCQNNIFVFYIKTSSK